MATIPVDDTSPLAPAPGPAFSKGGWPTLTPNAQLIARAALPMILNRKRWIHRQVETLTFLDADRMARRVSVDLTVPRLRGLGVDPEGQPSVVYLPVALLNRQVMENFDMRDELGDALPCLTLVQHDAIVLSMLSALSLDALEQTLGSNQLENPQARAAVKVLQGMIVKRDPQARLEWETACKLQGSMESMIVANNEARTLIEDLDTQFALFVAVRAGPGDRRIVKFSMEANIDEHTDDDRRSKRRERLGRVLMARPWDMLIEAPIAGRASSVHVEIPAPDELVIAKARLVERIADTDAQATDRSSSDATRWKTLKSVVGPTPMAHLHPDMAPPRGTLVKLEVSFALRRDGLLTAGALIALTTSGLLAAGVVLHLAGIAPKTDAAGAVIVALPALYAPVLATSSAHRLVRRMVGAVRAFVLGSALLSFIAAASLAAALPQEDRAWLWAALLVASLPCSAVLGAAWWRAAQIPDGTPLRAPRGR